MKLKSLLTLFLILVITGCNNTITTKDEDFIYSYELNSIEKEDEDAIQMWLHEPDQTATRTYEVHDENNDRYVVYAHSAKFSKVDVQQKGDAIIMIFMNEKVAGSSQDAFVKIRYNPDIIKNFVLDSE